MEKRAVISKKICMLGSFGVGKTSLVRRFVYNTFEEKYLSTIGVQISKKIITSVAKKSPIHSEQLNLILWDLAHVEKFDSVIKSYFRGSHGALIVFDLTRAQTLRIADVFLKPYLEMNPESKLVFVGNKIDQVDQAAIDVDQFLHLSDMYATSHFFTSAKTGENVEDAFSELAKLLLTSE
ncbi:GTP-binding protein [candidate division KSB1 bacterium]|nr:GTP-binding protein [candidate division KSB1 bacterium]